MELFQTVNRLCKLSSLLRTALHVLKDLASQNPIHRRPLYHAHGGRLAIVSAIVDPRQRTSPRQSLEMYTQRNPWTRSLYQYWSIWCCLGVSWNLHACGASRSDIAAGKIPNAIWACGRELTLFAICVHKIERRLLNGAIRSCWSDAFGFCCDKTETSQARISCLCCLHRLAIFFEMKAILKLRHAHYTLEIGEGQTLRELQQSRHALCGGAFEMIRYSADMIE